jgi:hypothetical protein
LAIQLNSTENGTSGNTANFAFSLLPQPKGLCPRTIYFRDGKLTVGLMVGISNKYYAQKIQLNLTENGPSGSAANSAFSLLPQPKGLCPENTHYFRDGKFSVGLLEGISNKY